MNELNNIEAHARAVMTKHRQALEDTRALVDFGDRMISVPLDAIARHADAPDCATAQIWHTAAWIKFQGSEFLE